MKQKIMLTYCAHHFLFSFFPISFQFFCSISLAFFFSVSSHKITARLLIIFDHRKRQKKFVRFSLCLSILPSFNEIDKVHLPTKCLNIFTSNRKIIPTNSTFNEINSDDTPTISHLRIRKFVWFWSNFLLSIWIFFSHLYEAFPSFVAQKAYFLKF